ncbi:MAG TPA: asparaginase [Noviherbaspirillum sp.]
MVLLSTGGTIASAPGRDGRSVSGALPGEVLVQRTELDAAISVEVRSVFQKPSNAIGPDDWAVLREQCEALIAGGSVDGIVISHGTDTLEDTAYYLECVLESPRVPVVLTGSQRVPNEVGTDAYANLRRAIELAAAQESRGLGVLVQFNESIFSASFVRKVSSFQLHGFDAPGIGPLGYNDGGRVRILQRPMRQPRVRHEAALPRVDIVPVYAGADAGFLQAVLASGPAGVVIDGLGRGHVPPDWMGPIRAAAERGVKVLVCSSTLHGPTFQSYEFPGSLHDLEQAGAVGVSDLSARKVRIRLALLLAAGIQDSAAIRRAFDWQSARQDT